MEQQGLYKRNVLFFKPEDVTRRNGEVFTPNNMGMSKLRKSEQFKKEVVFNGGMSESDVRIRLEEVFPVLINKRFSCAARSAQDSARLEFHGVRRIWNGRTIRTKLRGQSALYVVLEEESLVNQSSYLAEEGTLSTTAAMQVYSGVSSSASNHSHLSSMDISTSTFEDIPHDLKDVLTGHFYVNEGLLEKMECTPEADENFQGMFEPFNAMSSVQMYGQSESAQRDLPLVALRNNAFDDDNDGGNRRIPSELWRGQMPVTVSTDISGKPTESGYSSEECLTQRSTAIGSSVDINPTKGPLQGGIPFRLHFEKKLSESLNFGWALFADSQPVKAWKTCQDDVLYGDNIPPGTQAGNVVVTVLTQSNRYLGRTLFTYVDEEEQWLEQMVRNKKLQGKFFKKLCRKYESDESDESDEIGKQNSESSGSSNHGRQQNSLDVLRRLVYTAARIGAGEFIRMLFSTSARRIVFKAYKNRCPLPEDIADANGHYEIATYLRSATERFSSENEATQTSKDIDWLELARAAENSDAEAGSIKRPCKEQREGDNSGEEYFGDAETSSSDSEKEVYFSKENLKRDFDKDLESEGCVSKGNSVLVSEEAEKQPKCEVLVEERKCDGDGDSSCGSLRKVRSTSLDEGIDTFHKDIANLACFQDSEGISCDSNDCINCSTKHVHQTYVDQGNSDNSEGMKELNENERSAGDGNESSCASRLEPLGTGSEKKCNEDFFERMQSGLKEFAKNLFRRRNVVSRDIFQRLKDPPEPNESLEVRQNYSQSLEDQSAEFDSVKTNLAKEKCYKDENQDLAFYPQKQKTDVEEATKSLTDQLGIALANERRAKEELEKLKEEIKAERESEQAARVTEKQKRGVQISQLMDTFKHSLQAMNKKIDSLVTNIGQLPKIQVEIGGKAIEIDAHDGISDQTVQLKMALDDSRRQLEKIHRNALEMYKEEVEDLKAECSRAEFLAKAQDDYISQLHMKFNDVRRCAETTEEKYFFSLVIAAKLNMAVCGYRVDHLNHLEPQKLFETVREHGISIEYWPSWISRELSMAI